MQDIKQTSGIEPKKYYSMSEAANLLGVHRSTIWRWVKALRLRSRTRIVNGRREYLGSELEKLIKHI